MQFCGDHMSATPASAARTAPATTTGPAKHGVETGPCMPRTDGLPDYELKTCGRHSGPEEKERDYVRLDHKLAQRALGN